MATITLKYDARNSFASSLIETIKKSGVFHIEEAPSYDPKFVAKIERSRRSNGKAIKTEDLWK